MTDDRRTRVIAPVLALLIVAAFVLASLSFWNGRTRGCQRVDVTLDVLHDLLLDARLQVLQSEEMTPAEKTRVLRFYDLYLARVHDARC